MLIEPTRKKITDSNKIYDGKNLLIKEFINLDLSNLDLSNIPVEQWEGCIFYNTSFKNTGIKFIPNKLGNIPPEEAKKFYLHGYMPVPKGMYFCDFSDNDFTFLQRIDFCIGKNLVEIKACEYTEVGTYGCDFTNTGINFLKTLRNIKLDESYGEYDFESDYWKFETGTINWPDFIDIETIIKNPFLKVPSFRVMNAIAYYIKDMHKKYNLPKTKSMNIHGDIVLEKLDDGEIKYVAEIVAKCERFLKYDKEGYGKKLYEKLSPFFSVAGKYNFFQFTIRGIHIKDVDFEDVPMDVLRYYEIQNNILENVTMNNFLNDLLRMWNSSIIDFAGHENEYIKLNLPNINFSSWQENSNARKRVADSAITFFTKVYLELSRTCNASCKFCRNQTFEECEYNLENIKDTLNEIKSYINAVVIGGGEPTLRLDDVKYLYESLPNSKFEWHMFSNGTSPEIINDDYIMDNFKLNISRHAVNDEENASIFRLDSKKIMTIKEIEKLNDRNSNVTLNAVCFKGGLDSLEKIINYIKFASEIGCKKVLIQDLQKEMSLGNNFISSNDLCIDENLFFKVREYLKINGFKEKYPIYATGGYVSYILRNKEGFQVAIQKYITKEELEEKWISSIKRAFDLSISPNGELYEDWGQTTGKVKKIEL